MGRKGNKANTDHLVLITPPEYEIHAARCKHCGTDQIIELPMEIGAYVKLVRAFVRKHQCCPASGAHAALADWNEGRPIHAR